MPPIVFKKGHRKIISENLFKLLEIIKGGQFLEIGIGPKIRFKRIKSMHQLGIRYTGLDFSDICEMHFSKIKKKGLPIEHLSYIGNDVGTYLYNLIRLKRQGQQFDLIYLDGHHTLYVDFAATMACLPLLKPGRYFAFDDVSWTLADKEKKLMKNDFYSKLYDFSIYTEEEKREAHIGLIVEEYMKSVFKFDEVDELCLPGWTVLRSPQKND